MPGVSPGIFSFRFFLFFVRNAITLDYDDRSWKEEN